MQQLTPNVYVETGTRGCNPGFVTTSEGIVMIDTPQKPSDAIWWREEILRKGEPRYLINCEPHGDHISGNFFFPSAIGIAHQGTREAVLGVVEAEFVERLKLLDPDRASLLSDYRLKAPSVTFSDRMCVYLGRHSFELIHLPGHTASETAVYIPQERVVFTGDNVFHRVQSFLHQAYPDQWLESLNRIGELDVDYIVPGHGEVCDKSYLAEQAAFIQEWMDAVKGAIKTGWSKEEAMNKISFLDRYPMGTGLQEMGPEVQRWNVDRLYSLLLAK